MFELNCYRPYRQHMMEAARDLAKTINPATVKSSTLVFNWGSSESVLVKFNNAIDRNGDLESTKKLSAAWVDLREFVRAQSKSALHTANPTLDVAFGELAPNLDWKAVIKGSTYGPAVQVYADLRNALYQSVDVFSLADKAFDYRAEAENGFLDYTEDLEVLSARSRHCTSLPNMPISMQKRSRSSFKSSARKLRSVLIAIVYCQHG